MDPNHTAKVGGMAILDKIDPKMFKIDHNQSKNVNNNKKYPKRAGFTLKILLTPKGIGYLQNPTSGL